MAPTVRLGSALSLVRTPRAGCPTLRRGAHRDARSGRRPAPHGRPRGLARAGAHLRRGGADRNPRVVAGVLSRNPPRAARRSPLARCLGGAGAGRASQPSRCRCLLRQPNRRRSDDRGAEGGGERTAPAGHGTAPAWQRAPRRGPGHGGRGEPGRRSGRPLRAAQPSRWGLPSAQAHTPDAILERAALHAERFRSPDWTWQGTSPR